MKVELEEAMREFQNTAQIQRITRRGTLEYSYRKPAQEYAVKRVAADLHTTTLTGRNFRDLLCILPKVIQMEREEESRGQYGRTATRDPLCKEILC